MPSLLLRRSVLLSMLLAASPASAARLPGASAATLGAPVEVPLLAAPSAGDPARYVEARVGERSLLLRVATGHNELRLSPEAAARLKLHTTGKPEDGRARIEALALGTATVSHLRVHVLPIVGSGATAVDGELGLPGLTALDWAVLPSRGVLRLSPAGAHDASADPNSFALPDLTRLRRREVHVGKVEVEVDDAPLVAAVSFSGVPVPARWCLECAQSTLAREWSEPPPWTFRHSPTRDSVPDPPAPLPSAPGYSRGVVVQEWREVGRGDVTISTWVARLGQGPAWRSAPPAVVGAEVTGGYDLTVDTTHHRFTLNPGAPASLAPSLPVLEAARRADLVAAWAAKPDPVAAWAAKPGLDAHLGAVAGLAAVYVEAGRLPEAVTTWAAAAAAAPDRCDPLLELGRVQLASGDAAAAVVSFTLADALYAPWAARPLAERTELRSAHARAKSWTGPVPQPARCDLAVGLLAEAEVATHDRAAVAALYPARLDLDAALPRAAGIAALLGGQNQAAEAAFLQAITLGRGGEDPAARIGLYFARSAHDPEDASSQLARIRYAWEGATDPLLLRRQAELMRQDGRSAAVLAAAAAHLPDDPALLTQLAIEQRRAGGADGTLAVADRLYRARLAAAPGDGRLRAGYALMLQADGRVEEARREAQRATELAPGAAVAWYARAEVAAAGDPDALTWRQRAAIIGVDNPAYALLGP